MPALTGRTPLIGRAHERAVLVERLAAARGGAGGVVLLSGEAGVGKSRLVAEAEAEAGAHGMLILKGACFETDWSLPYAPFIDLLRALGVTRPPDALLDLLGSGAPELVKLLPEWAALLPDVQPSVALDAEQEKRRLFHALSTLCVRASAERPVLAVLEDLHWCDDTSLELLRYLARQLAGHPLLLLLTYRSDEDYPSLTHTLAELERERLATEIALSRLVPAEVDAMIRAVFHQERPVRAEFLHEIGRLTDGNPFFIEEVLKALVASGDIFFAEGQWDRRPLQELRIPRTVQDAVRRRVERLSDAARRALVQAAVVGQRFDFSLIEALTGNDEESLLRCLKELIAAQLVVEETEERFAFRHALTRQAVLAELLARERRPLHRRVAEAIEGRAAGGPEAHAEALSYHYFQAGAWPKALYYARLAGERAQAMYAPRAAVEHFTRAVDAAHALGEEAPAPVLRARGRAYETLGEFDRALADLEAALAGARRAGEHEGAWQALLDLGFLWASRDYARTGAYFRDALALARRLEEPAMIARALNRTGNWSLNVGRPLDAIHYYEEARVIFEQLGDRRGLAETFDLLGMAAIHSGDFIAGLGHYERAIRLFREVDDRMGLASALANMSLFALETPVFTEVMPALDAAVAVRACEESLQIAREIGWRAGEAYALASLSSAEAARNDFGRAFALLRESTAVVEEIGHQQWRVAMHCGEGEALLDALAFPAARDHLERALALAQAIGSVFWLYRATAGLAWACVRLGDLRRAEAVLADLSRWESGERYALARFCRLAEAGLALARGDAAAALALCDELIASAANRTPETVIIGLWLVRGDSLTALGRHAEAEAALQAAHEAARPRASLRVEWLTRASLARLYHAAGRRDDAEREAAAARSLVEQVAAMLSDVPVPEMDGASLGEIFRQGTAAFLPPPRALTPLRAARLAFGGLTARERDVAALIARGRSNREIADALVLSERTVEYHVSNVLAKLNATSRAQIAAWAVEHELT